MTFHPMFNIIRSVSLLTLAAMLATACGKSDENATKRQSTKLERNSIKEGNELYAKQCYAEAEIAYKKALQENADNTTARFNLASAYLKQRGEDLTNKGDSLISTADAMLAQVAQAYAEPELAEKAFYDRGNVAYKAENYAAAIEHYKNALRRNPSDEEARQNLRLAQLKKQEQDQNQDQNRDQQNQDQNQNKDQDQNKDKQENQQNQNQQGQQKQQEKKQQQGGLSDAGAQQILKAMEDKENGTRQKVELMKQGEEKRSNRRTTDKPW